MVEAQEEAENWVPELYLKTRSSLESGVLRVGCDDVMDRGRWNLSVDASV
jgi:hypothetical protein